MILGVTTDKSFSDKCSIFVLRRAQTPDDTEHCTEQGQMVNITPPQL